jgi:hypothetical protein
VQNTLRDLPGNSFQSLCRDLQALYFVSNGGTPMVTAHSPVMCSEQKQGGVSPVRTEYCTPH